MCLDEVQDQVELLFHAGHPGLHGGLVLLGVLHIITNCLQCCSAVVFVAIPQHQLYYLNQSEVSDNHVNQSELLSHLLVGIV